VVGPIFGFRLPPELVAELDAWAARQPDKPNRSDALRRLITEGIRS
jgi:metal-responsive CopG/Arc/MetJ family transcriptional regulator